MRASDINFRKVYQENKAGQREIKKIIRRTAPSKKEITFCTTTVESHDNNFISRMTTAYHNDD
jgi:hypothetical protein